MNFYFVSFLVFLVFMLVFHLCTKQYLNPYKLTMIFGKKGSGKSTLLTKLALEYTKRGMDVYTTEYINLPNVYQINPKHIGHYLIPPNSVLLVDEVGMIWDNRNFKNFHNAVRDWFKLQRHFNVRVYLFSQSFDIDKKLRDLTDEMYYITNLFRVFSYAKKINKNIVLNKSSADSPSSLAENLEFEPFIFFFLGSRKLTFIPKYAKYFDSFVKPTSDLELIPNEPCYHEQEHILVDEELSNELLPESNYYFDEEEGAGDTSPELAEEKENLIEELKLKFSYLFSNDED